MKRLLIENLDKSSVDVLLSKLKSVQQDEPSKISLEDESIAFYVIGLFRPKNIYDCFLIFSAGALCNAFVKKDYAPKKIKHSYAFKNFLNAQINILMNNDLKDVKILHNKDFSVVDIAGIKFSFHGLGEVFAKSNCSLKEANDYWLESSLRITPYATEMFEIAKNFAKKGLISQKNAKIYEIIENKLAKNTMEENKEVLQNLLQGINKYENLFHNN